MQTQLPSPDEQLDQLLQQVSAVAGVPLKPDFSWAAEPRRPENRLGGFRRDEELGGAGQPFGTAAVTAAASSGRDEHGRFMPAAPRTLAETGLSESEVEPILLRTILFGGPATGREIAQQVGLNFAIVEQLLHDFKARRLVNFKGSATLNDYTYELTELGVEQARRYSRHCTYFGTAPVALKDYTASVAAQSLSKMSLSLEDLKRPFADLSLRPEMFLRLGRAIQSGKGLFLYGPPGNGKTSIAQRITAAYGTSIWIPRAISAFGEIIRLYDPSCHEELPLAKSERLIEEEKLDGRWVRIRRPTIMVGGELTMDNLEITANKNSGVSEAPIQLKSNCGTLVIDDFGRQQIAPAVLLNRWIVPLEKRVDYVNLISGRKIQVPFDQFIVFSTNLKPKDLVDEAFLRRIPYKIDVDNPTEQQFRELFKVVAQKSGVEYCEKTFAHLLEKHYRATSRDMRYCHPRDLLHQVAAYCELLKLPAKMTIETIDVAAQDYFAIM